MRSFGEADEPIAAICHGPGTPIDAAPVNGKTVTPWPSLHTDLTNAGAKCVDREGRARRTTRDEPGTIALIAEA